MTHTSRCRGDAFVNDRLDHEGQVIDRTTRQCLTCGTWLGMGPSDEEPVRVEVRAAEIAAGFADDSGDCSNIELLGTISPNACHADLIESDESLHVYRDQYWAGWLAAEIHHHTDLTDNGNDRCRP